MTGIKRGIHMKKRVKLVNHEASIGTYSELVDKVVS